MRYGTLSRSCERIDACAIPHSCNELCVDDLQCTWLVDVRSS